MTIGGLQKLTLLDYPGKLACTVFLAGCSLRCPYCHNPALVVSDGTNAALSEDELFAFLSSRVGKLDGVCVSGGEATVHPELPVLLSMIRELGFAVKLDTNGTNPRMLTEILHEGLADYIAMDIKNCPARYAETCGGMDVLASVADSVHLLMNGDTPYEFRTTVCTNLHTAEGMREIGEWLHGAKRYFLQPFVDSGRLLVSGMEAPSAELLHQFRQILLPYIANTTIRGV